MTRRLTNSLPALLFVLLLLAPRVAGQGSAQLTLLSAEGRRALPIAIINDREFVSLDDLAAAFGFTVRAESDAVMLQRGTATIILNPGRALVSAAGRAVSLTAAPTRAAGRVMVPLDFINQALGPAAGLRLELRRPSRLVVIGDLVVPRVTVRHEPGQESARLIIQTTPRAAAALTQDGNRLLLAYTADALDLTAPSVTGQPFVNAIRMQDAVTVAIDLGPRVGSYRQTTESLATGTRLTIDLLPGRPDGPALTGGAPSPAPALPAAGAAGAGATAEIPELTRSGPVLQTLVIDPGHGGDDVGSRGPGGTLEKDITLSVARRLKSLVENRLGLRVLLTRDDDRSSPLERRTAVANNNKADVFLSLHANASMLPVTSGASLHIAAFDDAPQTSSSVVSERLPTFTGAARELQLVPWDVAQISHLSRSSEFANILGTSLSSVTTMAIRPLERGSYRVLESANMAAVIVELGYLTNPEEEVRLAGGALQDQLAAAMLDALVRYQQALSPGGDR